MLTLAAFVAEKFGGDTMGDALAAFEHYTTRIATAPEAPVAGGRAAHGLSGTDEAGSGGDD